MLFEIHTSFSVVNISDTLFFSGYDLPDRGFLTNFDIFEDNICVKIFQNLWHINQYSELYNMLHSGHLA